MPQNQGQKITPLPYEGMARAMAEAPEVSDWLDEVFPDVTRDQKEKAILNIAGAVHTGLEAGLVLHSNPDYSVLEAYQLGVREATNYYYETD